MAITINRSYCVNGTDRTVIKSICTQYPTLMLAIMRVLLLCSTVLNYLHETKLMVAHYRFKTGWKTPVEFSLSDDQPGRILPRFIAHYKLL